MILEELFQYYQWFVMRTGNRFSAYYADRVSGPGKDRFFPSPSPRKRRLHPMRYRIITEFLFVFIILGFPLETWGGTKELSDYCYHYQLHQDSAKPVGFLESLTAESIHPVQTASNALYFYQMYRESGEKRNLAEFMRGADALRNTMIHLESTNGKSQIGVWHYSFAWNYREYEIKAPWVSGMAQGMAISVLLRAYEVTQDAKYLTAAQMAFQSFLEYSPVRNEILFENGIQCWPEEYPPFRPKQAPPIYSHVLNGGLLGAFGIKEYADFTGDSQAKALLEKIYAYLEKNIEKYDIPKIGPSYGLLKTGTAFHFLNFETEQNGPGEVLPIYEIKISTDKGHLLRVIRSTGGCARYPYSQFQKGATIDFLLYSDKFYWRERMPVASLQLVTSKRRVVGELKMNQAGFYNSWSAPYRQGSHSCRDYLLQATVNKPSAMGQFKIRIDSDISADENLFLKIKYRDMTNKPVNLFLNTENKINLSFLHNKGDREWKEERIYIPRASDFENYDLYMNWGDVKLFDGRQAQSIVFKKYGDRWSGDWIKWKVNNGMERYIEQAKELIFDITYKDTSARNVFFNLFEGNNFIVHMLGNENTGTWKTERIRLPRQYFTAEGSHGEKTFVVTSALKAFLAGKDLPRVRSALARWENAAFNADRLTCVIYSKGNPENILIPIKIFSTPGPSLRLRQERIFKTPVLSSEKWTEGKGGFKTVNLKRNDFAYFYLPVVQDAQYYDIHIEYKGQTAKGRAFIAIKDLDRNETRRLFELVFQGSGKVQRITRRVTNHGVPLESNP